MSNNNNIFTCLTDKLYENNIEYLISTLLSTDTTTTIGLERAVGVKTPFFKPKSNITIRIETDDNASLDQIDQVKQILQTFAFPFINMNFSFVDETVVKPNIRIILSASNQFSGGITIGIGEEFPISHIYLFNQGTILHEFGHALGRFHEHQNPDPSNPLVFIKDQVYAYYKQQMGWDAATVDNQILNKLPIDLVSTLPFDIYSIMNYDIPSNLTTNGISTHRGIEYSDGDKQWYAMMYGDTIVNKFTQIFN